MAKTTPPPYKGPNYILGYGSLIEFESRTRTAPDALYVRPVRAMGYVRGWFARAATAGYSPTYLGAVLASSLPGRPAKPYLNGVIYSVTETELLATDAREDAGYTRVEVPADKVLLLDTAEQWNPRWGKVWIYLNNFSSPSQRAQDFAPNATFPIVQSYVDICMNGCLQIQTNFPQTNPAIPSPANPTFVQEFIETTLYWNEFWVNDRPMPRRPFMYRSNAYTIDNLLAKALPDQFSRMRIEPASWEAGPYVPPA